MRIIIGLGNPGDKFKTTRHNVGFMAVDLIAEQNGLSWKENKKFKAQIAEGTDFILVKPQTFMNLSGQSASAILRYYKLIPSSLFGIKKETDLSSVLTVIHDELDLNFGDFKVSLNSGSAEV
jgi:PTH1 family peptidyl-tRNA hydrolase